MTDQQEVGLPYALSIGAKIIDLEWSIRTWLQKRCIFWSLIQKFQWR